MKPNPAPIPHAASGPPLEVPDGLQAVYVNLVRISHSPAELVFDFAHLLPGSSSAQVLSRLVMSPIGAKLFYLALGENLARYEAGFGKIPVLGNNSLASNLFGSIIPPERPPKG
jgi:hypothetical protein